MDNTSFKKICCFALFLIFIAFSAYAINLRDYVQPQLPSGYFYKYTTSDDYELEIFQRLSDPSGNTFIKDYSREDPTNFPQVTFNDYKEFKIENNGIFISKLYEYDAEEYTDESFDPPLLFLPANMEVGEEVETVLGTVKLVSTGNTIEVPAGIFSECIELQITGGEWESTVYFARGVGEVKSEETDDGETEIRKLIAARIGDNIIGDSAFVGCGQNISFAFATPRVKGNSIILDGIYVKGYENTFWAKFDFNINTLSFELDPANVGQGSYDYDNIDAPSISGLSLNEELPFIYPCEKGADNTPAYLFVKANYNGEIYYLEFMFNPQNLSFDVIKIWDGSGTPIM